MHTKNTGRNMLEDEQVTTNKLKKYIEEFYEEENTDPLIVDQNYQTIYLNENTEIVKLEFEDTLLNNEEM